MKIKNKSFSFLQLEHHEFIIFIIVGLSATATHYFIALLFSELFKIDIYISNFIGYIAAVSVSFFGHGKLTFRVALNSTVFLRFSIASLCTLLTSETLLWFLAEKFLLENTVSLLVVVFFIPVFTFFINKFWVYRK